MKCIIWCECGSEWFYMAAIRNVVERRCSFECQGDERSIGAAGAGLQFAHEAIKECHRWLKRQIDSHFFKSERLRF